jgi:hypothetical protein
MNKTILHLNFSDNSETSIVVLSIQYVLKKIVLTSFLELKKISRNLNTKNLFFCFVPFYIVQESLL